MSLTVEELEMEAMQLPARFRAELAGRLMESVDEEVSPDAVVDKAWIEEAIRRRDEVRSGRSKTVSADTVLSEARERLRG